MSKNNYSLDLRERVIKNIEMGSSQAKTARLFHLSKSTVNRWWIRYQETGSFAPKARIGSKGKINPEDLKNYVESNPDKILSEIAKEFGVSICAVYKRLKKLGFSYKKKLSPTWKQTKKSVRFIKKL